ncbi:MAG: RluA family pseudouridine synthase [Alphaproteobacteria bacterium]|nr:RluA family pseudouridine synthase [Alphaproteobacteria bacterium]
MTKVTSRKVSGDEAGMRLDRWFTQHYPGLGHGRLQKLLRTGQVRVDGGRVKSGTRLDEGQTVRVPPLKMDASVPAGSGIEKAVPRISKADAKDIQACVLHRDEDIIILNKPPGLAVQGGSRLSKHLDGLLDALRFEKAERPRLVHRLDKDTSGILLLARNAPAARALTSAFRGKEVRKVYWAVVAGVPSPEQGTVALSLAKQDGPHGEKVVAGTPDGKNAETLYRTVDQASGKAAWLVLEPLTGRTHQLRVHVQALGTPIVGDGKYGRREAFPDNIDIAGKLHLHARALRFQHPAGHMMDAEAPLPDHMKKTFKVFGFDEAEETEPFLEAK